MSIRRLHFFFLFLLPFSLLAQDTTKTHRKPLFKPIAGYMRDTIVPAGPNEIVVNIAPVFTTLLGAVPDNEARWSIMYKRALKNPRSVLRAGVMYRPAMYTTFHNTEDYYYAVTDSTRIRNTFDMGKRRPVQFNIGFERRTEGNYRWSAYIALDAMFGFYNRTYKLTDYNERLDTNGYWNIDFNQPPGVLELDRKTSFNYYFGANPNIGARYAFSSHWMMSLQAGVDLVVFRGAYYERESQGYSLKEKSLDYFGVETSGLFNEFAVTYRF